MEIKEKNQLRSIVNKGIKGTILIELIELLLFALFASGVMIEFDYEEICDYLKFNKMIVLIGIIQIVTAVICLLVIYLYYKEDNLTKRLFQCKKKMSFFNFVKIAIFTITLESITAMFNPNYSMLQVFELVEDKIKLGVSIFSVFVLIVTCIVSVALFQILNNGYILRSLDKFGGMFAVIVVAAIQWCPIFCVENILSLVVMLIAAYIAYYYSLKYSIILSILYSSISIMVSIMVKTGNVNIVFKIIMIIFIAISMLIAIQYCKVNGKNLIEQIKESNLKINKFKAAFTSALFLIALIAQVIVNIKKINIPSLGFVILIAASRYLNE